MNKPPEYGHYTDVVANTFHMIDVQIEGLKAAWQAFAQKPGKNHLKTIEDSTNAHVNAVKLTFERLSQEYPEDTATTPLAITLMDLEQRRVNFLNSLSTDEPYEANNDDVDEVEAWLAMKSEEGNELQDAALAYYVQNLQADTINFLENSKEAYDKLPQSKFKHGVEIVGKHTLDIAKVTVGVALGAAAINRFSSRR